MLVLIKSVIFWLISQRLVLSSCWFQASLSVVGAHGDPLGGGGDGGDGGGQSPFSRVKYNLVSDYIALAL